MSDLHPELKRLIAWSRQAPPTPVPPIPLGFTHRVVQAWLESPAREAFLWQRAVSNSAWAAAAVILVGLALLASNWPNQTSPYDFGSAYQFVFTQLVP